MEDRKNIAPVNWSDRNKVFIYHALNGMSLQDAYDLAMCRMHRLANMSLPWKKPPKSLIEMLRNYEEKTEEE